MASPPERWVFDCEADARRDAMVLWLHTGQGVERREVREPLRFYVHSRRGLAELQGALRTLDDVVATRVVERRLSFEQPRPRRVLEVAVHRYRQFKRIAALVDGRGGYRDYQLHNVDLHPAAQFLAAHGLFPLGRCDPSLKALEDAWDLDYAPPPVRVARLDASPARQAAVASTQDPLGSIAVGDAVLAERDHDEAALLRALQREVERQDPDCLLTEGGDERLFPWLYARAAVHGVDLQLGRAPAPLQAARDARSLFSYGRIEYHAPFYTLRGRWHVDAHNSMFMREGGLPGVYDLARTSGVPVQTTARLGAGSAITMMQVHKAVALGFLVPWKKSRPEDFKSGLQLLATDKGGYIFEPRVGLHEDVVELDFASMYPNIMVSRNISAETLNCACCARGEGLPVPGLGSWTCAKRIGLVPRYLKPVIDRRFHHKARAKALATLDPEAAAVAKGINNCLKWCLLVSFGYQGYRNARFGRLECHEAISAWGRHILTGASELAQELGWDVLHGIVDSLWVKPSRAGCVAADELARRLGQFADIDLAIEGRYDWIVFLPTMTDGARALAEQGRMDAAVGAMNRYYGRFEDGTLKARGVEVRRSDTCTYVCRFQEAALAILGEARDGPAVQARIPEVVRCLRAFTRALLRGEVPGEELALGSTVSKPLDEYRVLTDAVSALRQLADHGVAREPGQWVGYVVTHHASRDARRKARPLELWRPEDGYDAAFYAQRLARAAESLLIPFGWTEERLLRALQGTGAVRLDAFAAA